MEHPKTDIFILANSKESLDRTMACLPEPESSIIYNSITLISSPGSDVVDPEDDVFAWVHLGMSLPASFNIGRSLALNAGHNALFIRSGAEFDAEDLNQMVTDCEMAAEGITMATILDPHNGNIELTHSPGSVLPQPLFQKGERRIGYSDAWWLDGPVIFVSHGVLLDTGAFDEMMGDNYCTVDYAIRTRWLNGAVSICHSMGVTFVNQKPYNTVFIDRATQVFFLARANFTRKYGGSILATLTTN